MGHMNTNKCQEMIIRTDERGLVVMRPTHWQGRCTCGWRGWPEKSLKLARGLARDHMALGE